MATNYSFLSRVENFNGANWSRFKKDLQVYFQLEGSWDVVDGTIAKPPSRGEGYADWIRMDERAYSIIYFLIDVDYRGLIGDVNSGAEAWKILKEEFQKDSAAQRLALRHELYSITHDATKRVGVYIEAIQSTRRQLKAINHDTSDEEISDLILLRLHPSFALIRSTLSTTSPFPKLAAIISAIKAFEIQEKISTSIADASDVKPKVEADDNEAMIAGRGPKGHFHGSKHKFDWGNTKELEGVCHRCGQHGHIARRCVADMPHHVKAKILKGSDRDSRRTAAAGVLDDDWSEYDVACGAFAFESDSALSSSLDIRSQIEGVHEKKKRVRRGRGKSKHVGSPAATNLRARGCVGL